MIDTLPTSVKYVKNGAGGQWWKAAKASRQVHLGWGNITPKELLLKPDFIKIEQFLKNWWGPKQGAKQDFNALQSLLDDPSQHIWVTFEDGYMWWCTVQNGACINPDGESHDKGNFWLVCNHPWSNQSVKGKLLARTDLPGAVAKTSGFKGTVCTPAAWQTILRIIRDEKDPDALKAASARTDYQQAIHEMVKRLSWKDFEQLVDLILSRSGWVRICKVGGNTEGIDVEVQNVVADEIAFVQVKSAATQQVLDEYIGKFENRRKRYARMIFAVHTPIGKLTLPADRAVQLWEGELIARFVVQLGLGEWVESRLA